MGDAKCMSLPSEGGLQKGYNYITRRYTHKPESQNLLPPLGRYILSCEIVHRKLDRTTAEHPWAPCGRSAICELIYPPIVDGLSVNGLLERQHQSRNQDGNQSDILEVYRLRVGSQTRLTRCVRCSGAGKMTYGREDGINSRCGDRF